MTEDRSREIAKQVVYQWDNHDKFRAVEGEDNSEPDEVVVARALLRVDAEYGCEVRDPCGTIWQHAAKLQQERDEMWTRDSKLLEAMQSVIDMSFDNTKIHRERFDLHYRQNGEKMPPGWRVVEAIRDIAIEAIEAYRRTVRETIELDKMRDNASRG